jgi:hypothetical protein
MNFKLAILSTFLLGSSAFATQAAPDNAGPNSTQTQAEVAPIKKVDPKLQAKLNVKVDNVSEEQYHKIVDEYKQYLRTISADVRSEIKAYRQEIVQINKTKSAMYKKLSQEAQKFLAKERDIKKKLPIQNRGAFAKDVKDTDSE